MILFSRTRDMFDCANAALAETVSPVVDSTTARCEPDRRSPRSRLQLIDAESLPASTQAKEGSNETLTNVLVDGAIGTVAEPSQGQ